MAEWWSGGVAEWRSGGVAEWRSERSGGVSGVGGAGFFLRRFHKDFLLENGAN
ncbi:MAG: hypothetical protein OCU12_06940 [Methanophagales archaeon]|nr:hypothetical protein [Methanophagales archaeon]